MANVFDKIVASAGNDYASKAEDGLDSDVTTFIDTGSLSFNGLLSGSIYGGMPGNKISVLAGEEATGKTFYALAIARAFLEQNKKGAVVYFESEGSLTKTMLEERGFDTSRIYVVPVLTIQEFRTQAMKMLDEYMAIEESDREPLFMVLDSLGNLSTNKEVTDIGEGKDTRDMTRAQLIRGTFRALSLKLSRAKVSMLITNHVYDVIGAYVPTQELSGGGGIKYAASSIVFLSKSKNKDKTTNEVTGVIIKARNKKSRLTVENKVVETLLDYQKGLDRYYGLLDLAIACGVAKEVSTKIKIGDQEAFRTSIIKNPTKYFTKEILDEIDVGVGKLFRYGGELNDVASEED